MKGGLSVLVLIGDLHFEIPIQRVISMLKIEGRESRLTTWVFAKCSAKQWVFGTYFFKS